MPQEKQTPMIMVFNYIDSMINDNIDWLELKEKALKLESQSLEDAEKKGYVRCLMEHNLFQNNNY
jgi:hypothetical protein